MLFTSVLPIIISCKHTETHSELCIVHLRTLSLLTALVSSRQRITALVLDVVGGHTQISLQQAVVSIPVPSSIHFVDLCRKSLCN